MRRIGILAGCALTAVALAAALRAAAPGEDDDRRARMMTAWRTVRMTKQQVRVTLTRERATYLGQFELLSGEPVEGAVFAFPLQADGSGTEAAAAACDGTPLASIPHTRPPTEKQKRASWKELQGGGKQALQARAKRERGRQIRELHDAFFDRRTSGTPDIVWQAHQIVFEKDTPRSVRVETSFTPVPLADSAVRGSCTAFTVPIRLGAVWARPAGTLDIEVTLDPSIDPADIVAIRPPEAARTDRVITLSLDGEDPLEDLIIIVARPPEELLKSAPR